MDKKNFFDLRQRQANGDPFRAMAQTRVDTYNQSRGEDDGSPSDMSNNKM